MPSHRQTEPPDRSYGGISDGLSFEALQRQLNGSWTRPFSKEVEDTIYRPSRNSEKVYVGRPLVNTPESDFLIHGLCTMLASRFEVSCKRYARPVLTHFAANDYDSAFQQLKMARRCLDYDRLFSDTNIAVPISSLYIRTSPKDNIPYAGAITVTTPPLVRERRQVRYPQELDHSSEKDFNTITVIRFEGSIPGRRAFSQAAGEAFLKYKEATPELSVNLGALCIMSDVQK